MSSERQLSEPNNFGIAPTSKMPRQTRSQSRSQSRDASPELLELDFSRRKPRVKKIARGKLVKAAKAVQPPPPAPAPEPVPVPREPTPPPPPPPPPPEPEALPAVPEESPEKTPVQTPIKNSPLQTIFSKVQDSVKSFLFRTPSPGRIALSSAPDSPTPADPSAIPSLNEIELPDKPEYHETPRRLRGPNTPKTAPVRRIQRNKTPKTVPARRTCAAVTETPLLVNVPGVKTPAAWWYDRAKGIAPNGRVVQPHTQRWFQKKIKEYDEAVVDYEKGQAQEKEAQLVAEVKAKEQAQQQAMAEIQADKNEGKRVHDDSEKYEFRIKNGVKELRVPEDMLRTLPPIANPAGAYGMDLDYFDDEDEEEDLIWVSQEFWEQNRVDAAPPTKRRRLADRYPDRVKPADYTDEDWELVLKYGAHPDPNKQSTFGVPEYDDEDTSMADLTDEGSLVDISMMSAGSTAGKPPGYGRSDPFAPSTPKSSGINNIFDLSPAPSPTPAGSATSTTQADASAEGEESASPPPPPRPSHAQLPRVPETPTKSSSLDPVARQRLEAQKYKPVQSSRLREVSAATPSSIASLSPNGSPITPKFTSIAQEPVIVVDEMVTEAVLAAPLQPLHVDWPATKPYNWAADGLTQQEQNEVYAAVMAVPQEKVEKEGLRWFSQYLAERGTIASATA